MAGYTPVPTYHTTVELADGSAAPTAAAFNPGLEGALDNAAYLKALADASKCVPVYREFLATETITIPSDAATFGFYEGCGGGGAGGRGGSSPVTGEVNAGGGGGGGALLSSGMVPLVPGESYTVNVGDGGTGTDPLFGIGNNGGDTTLVRNAGGTVVARCRGAQGGQPSIATCKSYLNGMPYGAGGTPGTANQYAVARGGRPVRLDDGLLDLVCQPSTNTGTYYDATPSKGGDGVCSTFGALTVGGQATVGMRGNDSPRGHLGGLGGIPGTHNAVAPDSTGGGGGGGGGAGAYGNGGNGGNGSNATGSVSASAAPAAGQNAAANTGGGGGGGGGAGAGVPRSTSGAAPGNGGKGRYRLVYFRKMVP